jgi:hypothetical protein
MAFQKGNLEMKYYMARSLKFWVEAEHETTKHKYSALSRSQIIAGILGRLENGGYASRYLRKDGKLGWRATDEMREELFKQEQKAIYAKLD